MERRRPAKREQGEGDDFLDSPIDQRYPVGGMIMVTGKKTTILLCSICLFFTFTGCGKKDVETINKQVNFNNDTMDTSKLLFHTISIQHL